MITVLAIIMSLMILVLAVLIAGVAVLAYDNSQERDFLRVQKEQLERKEAHLEALQEGLREDVMAHHNATVNRHF